MENNYKGATMKKWTIKDMPSQAGKTIIITGGTSGIGYESALALAQAGAEVIITGRDLKRCQEAVQNIKTKIETANISFEILDLASLESVKKFAATIQKIFHRSMY